MSEIYNKIFYWTGLTAIITIIVGVVKLDTLIISIGVGLIVVNSIIFYFLGFHVNFKKLDKYGREIVFKNIKLVCTLSDFTYEQARLKFISLNFNHYLYISYLCVGYLKGVAKKQNSEMGNDLNFYFAVFKRIGNGRIYSKKEIEEIYRVSNFPESFKAENEIIKDGEEIVDIFFKNGDCKLSIRHLFDKVFYS